MKKYIKYIGPVILVFILYRADWWEFYKALKDVAFISLIPVYLISLIKELSASYRWHLLLKSVSIKRNFFADLKLYMAGIMIGVVTPGRLGEIYKAFRLSKDKNTRIKGVFTIFLDRFLDLSFILIISILAVFFFIKPDIFKTFWPRAFLVTGVIVMFLFYVVLLNCKDFSGKLLKKIFKIEISSDRIEYYFKKFDINLLMRTGIITIIAWLINYYQIYLLGINLGIEISYVDMVFVQGIVSLAAALPVTIAGLGTREIVMINSLAVFSVSKENALALSFLIYTLMIFNLIISSVFWILEHRRMNFNRVNNENNMKNLSE